MECNLHSIVRFFKYKGNCPKILKLFQGQGEADQKSGSYGTFCFFSSFRLTIKGLVAKRGLVTKMGAKAYHQARHQAPRLLNCCPLLCLLSLHFCNIQPFFSTTTTSRMLTNAVSEILR